MAAIGGNVLTLLDWAKRQENGKVAQVIEMLAQQNEILLDMLWMMGNLEVGHKFTARTSLPNVYYRLINGGVQVSKSTTAQGIDQTAMLEAYSEIDVDEAELNGDVNAYRLSEAVAFIEALNQQTSVSLFYGNATVNQEQFTGLSPRFSTLSSNANPLPSSVNTLDAEGTTSNNQCSVWLAGWSERTLAGIFPKGSQAGIFHEDLGKYTLQTSVVSGTVGNPVGSSRQRVYGEHWQWKQGLTMPDYRSTVRICNIDSTDLVTKAAGAADLIELMIRAWHRVKNRTSVKLVWYMNRTLFEMLDIQARDQVGAGGQLKYEEVDGIPQLSFRGVPIRNVDSLLTTESVVA